jgi:hypothetical protein
MRPYLEKTFTKKRAGGVAQGVGPEFKPEYHTYTKIICIHRQYDHLSRKCNGTFRRTICEFIKISGY